MFGMPHSIAPLDLHAALRDARARAYVRARDLPPLLVLWPAELSDASARGHLALLTKLRRALRRERKAAIAGHWTYDVARHAALGKAYRAEVALYLSTAGALPAQI